MVEGCWIPLRRATSIAPSSRTSIPARKRSFAFKPGMSAKYMSPVPYGACDQAGTPSAWTMQNSQHAPMELISSPSRVVVMTEYPLDVRMIYMNRPHPKDPDPTFNGDSAAHWEGDTLVVDVISIDDRLRNVAVGGSQAKETRGCTATKSTSSSAGAGLLRTTLPTRLRSRTRRF